MRYLGIAASDRYVNEGGIVLKRRLLILDDDRAVLDTYRSFFSTTRTQPKAVVSSRSSSRTGAVAAAVAAPQPVEEISFEVEYVTSGLQALEVIEKSVRDKNPFAGGFFDVKLGDGIDGIETIRRAKGLTDDFLFVIVTAYQDRNIEEISKIFGLDFLDRWDFLSKPFTRSEILQKANNLVSNWERRIREREHLQKIEAQHQQLVLAERMAAIGTLARGIGHEFGNILLRIVGVADVSQAKNDMTALKDGMKVILGAAERAGVIVRNLQSFVRMESKRERGDLTAPLKEAISLITHEARKANVTIVDLTPSLTDNPLPQVLLNRVEMGQVFLNILINAIHAMEPQGGEIKVQASSDEKGITVELSDTGCGIPPENLTKIFEPLFTTKGERGSGIGLSISRKIVENHNGRLTATSTMGKGSTFTIFIPLN